MSPPKCLVTETAQTEKSCARAGCVQRGLGTPFSRRYSVPSAEDDWRHSMLQLNTDRFPANEITVIELLANKEQGTCHRPSGDPLHQCKQISAVVPNRGAISSPMRSFLFIVKLPISCKCCTSFLSWHWFFLSVIALYISKLFSRLSTRFCWQRGEWKFYREGMKSFKISKGRNASKMDGNHWASDSQFFTSRTSPVHETQPCYVCSRAVGMGIGWSVSRTIRDWVVVRRRRMIQNH